MTARGWVVGALSMNPRIPPSIVQHKMATFPSASTGTVTLDTAPTPGNILFAFIGHGTSQIFSSGTFYAAGSAGHANTNGSAELEVVYRTVASGDGATWTFAAGSSASFTIELVEIAGSDGTPGGWGYNPTNASAPSVTTTATFTNGQLLLVFGTADTGGGVTTITATGYTKDDQGIPGGHSGIYGHAAGTGSSQTFTSTWDGSPGVLVQNVVAVT